MPHNFMIAEKCVSGRGLAYLRARLVRYFKELGCSDSGVVTVEWVALAAGMVIGTIAVSFILMSGLAGAAHNVANQLSP